MSLQECKILEVIDPTNPRSSNQFLKLGNELISVASFGHGFMNQALFDEYFEDQTQPMAAIIKAKMDPEYFLAVVKTEDPKNQYVESVSALKLEDAAFLEWFNAIIQGDQTNIDNFNIVPFLNKKSLDIHLINDTSKTFSTEGSLITFFTTEYIGVKSLNQFLDFNKREYFINSFMFFTNVTLDLKMEIAGSFLLLKNPNDSQLVDIIDTRKIYKCAVYQNVVPFATDKKDKSWCGLAFPQGNRHNVEGTSVKFIYVANQSKNYKCMHLARSLQNKIQDMCSNDDPSLHQTIQSQVIEQKSKKFNAPSSQAEKVLDDTNIPGTSNSVQFINKLNSNELLKNLKSERDELKISEIELTNKKHQPSRDNRNVRLDRVIRSLLPEIEGLDEDVQFINDITKFNELNKVYRPNIDDEEQITKQQTDFLKEKGENIDTFRQRNVNILDLNNNVQQQTKPDADEDKKMNGQRKVILSNSAFKISTKLDKVMTTDQTFDSQRFWIKKCKDIFNLNGRGTGISRPELIQDEIAPQLSKPELISLQPNPSEENEKISQLWYDLETDAKTQINIKQFKSYGKLNGDVLEQKQGCCGVFTSQQAGLILTMCRNYMKLENDGKIKYYDIQGRDIHSDLFEQEQNECLGEKPKPNLLNEMPLGESPASTPTLQNGTLTLPAQNNTVTTVKDGQIIKDDGTIMLAEQVGTNTTQVQKPGESVNIAVNPDGSVSETVVNAQGTVVSTAQLNAALDSIAQQVETPAAQVPTPNPSPAQNQVASPVDQPLQQGTDNGVVTALPTPNPSPGNPQTPLSADGQPVTNNAVNEPTPTLNPNVPNAPGQQTNPATPAQPVPAIGNVNVANPATPAVPGQIPPQSQPSTPANSPQVLPNQPAVSPVTSRNPVEITNDNMTPSTPADQPVNAPNSPSVNQPNRPVQPNPSPSSPAAGPTNQPAVPQPQPQPQPQNQLPPGVITDQPLGSGRQPRRPSPKSPAPSPNSENPALPRQQIYGTNKAGIKELAVKVEPPGENADVAPPGVIVRDLGQYNIWIDKENIVTIHEKAGDDRTKYEHVQNAYREGDIVWINFQNGDKLKHFLNTGETIKILKEKNLVEHIYPDKSIIIDDKNKKLKHINNRQGVTATFDLQGNKFMDKDVKSHFRYGSDVIQVMTDGTTIIKKAGGESVIMKPDNSVEKIDKFGNLKFKQDDRLHVDQNMESDLNERSIQTNVQDTISGEHFKMFNKSSLYRAKNKLQEVLPNGVKLQIRFDKNKNYQYKKRINKNYEEKCYENLIGSRLSTTSKDQFKCDCNKDYVIDLWTCNRQSNKLKIQADIVGKLIKNKSQHDVKQIDTIAEDKLILNKVKSQM